MVICYYEAQSRLVNTRIDEKYEVHTVDSAQVIIGLYKHDVALRKCKIFNTIIRGHNVNS